MGGEVSGWGLGEVDSELGLCGRLLGRPEPVPCDSQSVQATANPLLHANLRACMTNVILNCVCGWVCLYHFTDSRRLRLPWTRMDGWMRNLFSLISSAISPLLFVANAEKNVEI